MKNLTVQINRLNYKKQEGNGGYKILPVVCSTEKITDINEVESVMVMGFETIEQAEIFAARFPKYTKMKVTLLHSIEEDMKSFIKPIVSVDFNTFWLDEVTGSKNEAAIKRRNRVINTLKQMNL